MHHITSYKENIANVLCVYEDRKMKLVETVLRIVRGMRVNDGGVDLTKIHHKHIYKCHNATHLYNFYIPIKM
jgi:hypothetical protein